MIRDCEATFQTEGTCVVMLHPQDFVTDGVLDAEKYREYELLLEEIKERDYNVVRFKDMSN